MNRPLPITVDCQNVNDYKKSITIPHLSGMTEFEQKAKSVKVIASGDHQKICSEVLGKGRLSYLDSYIEWTEVSAIDVVQLMFVISRRAA